MEEKTNHPDSEKQPKRSVWMIILVSIILVMLFVFLSIVFMRYLNKDAVSGADRTVDTNALVQVDQSSSENQTETAQETEATGSEMLAKVASLHAQNADVCGWLTIEGTELDYPLMFTPKDPEKYLRKDFEGNYDINGIPFVDSDCSLDPESDNLIIYGHNMVDGSMFRTIMMYKDESYWKEHPTVLMYTLDEMREYEVLAAFYDRVYYTYENCFKFYQFIDAQDEADYQEAIDYYKSKSVYDTGVTAEYGDRLLTLVTCSYHHEHGRFVVVAREKKD